MTSPKTNSSFESRGTGVDSVYLFSFLLKWWKPLLIVVLIATVASIIFSAPYFIKPQYKSTVILFPTTTNSISKALLSDNLADKQDILEFGAEEQAEQLLQLLNSDEIRGKITAKYDLMKHYGIDSAKEKYPFTKLYKEYESNISFERTEFMSVKITVYDTDAKIAADIANDISSLLDSVKIKIQKERAVEGLRIIEREYREKIAQMQKMEDSLKGIRNKGIYNYESQSIILNEEYTKSSSIFNNETAKLSSLQQNNGADSSIVNTKARIKGAEATLKNLKAKLTVLADFGGANVSLTEQLSLEQNQLSLLKAKYEKAKVDVQQILPQKFVVNKATKAEKKTYPIRWLIVLLSALSALFLAILVLLGIENYQQFKGRYNMV